MEPRKPLPLPASTTASPPANEITGGPTGAVTPLPGPPRQAQAPSSSRAAVAVTTTSLLAAAGLGGAALLAWWAVAFRRANAMLWMVPAGLVLLGTPLVAWLSVLASATPPPPPPTADDLGAAQQS